MGNYFKLTRTLHANADLSESFISLENVIFQLSGSIYKVKRKFIYLKISRLTVSAVHCVI